MDRVNCQPGLITICGPTAAGKSGLAIALAQRLGSPILSADSRQVYREFDIGTAKPDRWQRQQVPHYLIDICAPTKTLTVAEYQQQGQDWIAAFQGQGKLPLLVGGTGLYLRAIVQGLQIPQVAPQGELRSQFQALGQSQIHTLLQQVDPISARKIHPHDPVRTMRALEVFYVTGVPMSRQQGRRSPLYPILQIGLDSEPNTLTRRIQHRTEQMVAAGWIAEVKSLCQRHGPDLSLFNTLGYQEIKQHLAGEISLTEAQALTVRRTRQLAKRQRTWFRADPQINWFNADDPDLLDQVWQQVQRFIDSLKVHKT